MPVSTTQLVVAALLLRVAFFAFGLYQDKYMLVKYTDIDYLVFSDAARYVSRGLSPYLRETYRYTPFLAWMLVSNTYWYSFGKFVFIASDLVTGIIVLKLLRRLSISHTKQLVLGSLWLLNPMVITISTRGSSESVLTVLILALVYYLRDHPNISAVFLGLLIHFKIYPVIYLPAFMLHLVPHNKPFVNWPVARWVNVKNLVYLAITVFTVAGANAVMYHIYGHEFLQHSYLYHLSRLDHRHNFSVYNISLYYKSARMFDTNKWWASLINNIEKVAFVPQLLVSAVILPLYFARTKLLSCLFLQTFAFVLFNKVMTSQYFIWYLIFLPFYLAELSLLQHKLKGLVLLGLWVGGQAVWLFFAYQLEFLGINTFDTGLLYSSVGFYLANCYLLGEFISLV